jgi:NAD(P)H-dependent FMN reductase
MTRVVAVSGSRRDGSYTRLALARALEAAGVAGAETELLDLGAVDLPLYHPDQDDQGAEADLTRRMRRADGVILGSPVYHGSYSSTLKNFHDYCGSDEYEDTVVGLLAVAGGSSYGSTLDHMRITVRNVHGWVLPNQVGVPNASRRFENGRLVDEDLRDRVDELGRLVARHAGRFPAAETVAADD